MTCRSAEYRAPPPAVPWPPGNGPDAQRAGVERRRMSTAAVDHVGRRLARPRQSRCRGSSGVSRRIAARMKSRLSMKLRVDDHRTERQVKQRRDGEVVEKGPGVAGVGAANGVDRAPARPPLRNSTGQRFDGEKRSPSDQGVLISSGPSSLMLGHGLACARTRSLEHAAAWPAYEAQEQRRRRIGTGDRRSARAEAAPCFDASSTIPEAHRADGGKQTAVVALPGGDQIDRHHRPDHRSAVPFSSTRPTIGPRRGEPPDAEASAAANTGVAASTTPPLGIRFRRRRSPTRHPPAGRVRRLSSGWRPRRRRGEVMRTRPSPLARSATTRLTVVGRRQRVVHQKGHLRARRQQIGVGIGRIELALHDSRGVWFCPRGVSRRCRSR